MVPALALAMALLLTSAQDAPSAADDPEAVTVRMQAVTLAPGGTAEAVATVTIPRGRRIQANPTPGRYLLPTMLLLQPAAGIHAEAPVYPPGKPFRLAEDDFKFSGYEGTIEIRVPIKAALRATPGDYTLSGRLRYQASTPDEFLRPVVLPVTLEVQVKKPG